MADQSDLDADLRAEQLLYAIGLRHNTGRALAVHGTDAAYKRHLRWGEEPCEPCRKANTKLARAKRNAPPPPDSGRRQAIVHGTLKGYQQHLYRGEVTCPECREARAAYQRDRKVARRTTPAA